MTYLPRLKSDGLLPPSGVCADTGAPGAPNNLLGDPGDMLRKLLELPGRALNALLLAAELTGAVPRLSRSPSCPANPPSGSCTAGPGNIEVGGGGLGVGLTGPTGGTLGVDWGLMLDLLFIWASKGWEF